MKTYTKERHHVSEIKRIAIWLNTAGFGEMQLLPIFDDSKFCAYVIIVDEQSAIEY